MSFQAYINNIKLKTGKGPDDFKKLAEKKGFTKNGEIKDGIKAGDIVKWLKEDFDLGHGHAMSVYTLLKGIKTWIAKNSYCTLPVVMHKY
ncbi:MAG TPA: DUF4287 domain-containing protein [Panacibacter sp.]|nr:DUF4287 domain-containing protein [Panacibacter sp.]